jgi:hypothetical protein
MSVYHVDNGTWRFMVAAKNQKETCALLHCTLGELRRYGGRYPRDSKEVEICLSEPVGTVLKKDMRELVVRWVIHKRPEVA